MAGARVAGRPEPAELRASETPEPTPSSPPRRPGGASITGAPSAMPKTYAELLRAARDEIREVSPAEADALRRRGGVALVDVREASEWDQGHVPGAPPRVQEPPRAGDRGGGPGPRHAGRPVLRRRGPLAVRRPDAGARWATRTSSSMSGGFEAWKSQGLEWTQPVRPHRRAAAALQPPPADPRGRAPRARRGCSPRGCCWSAPAGSARRPRCTSPRPASGRSGSSTSTSSTSRTSSARSSTRPTGWARRRSSRPGRTHRRRSTRTCTVVAARGDAASPDNVERLIAGYDVDRSTGPTRSRPGTSSTTRGRRRDPGRPRVGVPVRGPAHDLRPVRGPVLPLPLPDARRRPSSRPAAPWPASWASCPGSWACCRPTRCSSCCSGSARRSPAACVLFDALETEFTELRLRRDPACPVCSDAARAAREAGTPLPLPPPADGVFTLGAAPAGPRSRPAGRPALSTVKLPGGPAGQRRRGPRGRGRRGHDRRAARRRSSGTYPALRGPAVHRRRRAQPLRQRLRERAGRALPRRAGHRRSPSRTRSGCCRRWRAG